MQTLPTRRVILIGSESAGKTTLVAALSKTRSRATNMAGSTIATETYLTADTTFIDTPGIIHRGDTDSTKIALDALQHANDTVLLVARATHLDDDLAELLPLVANRYGIVVITHFDRVDKPDKAHAAITLIARTLNVPFISCDAREAHAIADNMTRALRNPGRLSAPQVLPKVGWRIQPPLNLFDHRFIGPPLGLIALLCPAVLVVWTALAVAGRLTPAVMAASGPAVNRFQSLPTPFAEIIGGDYGLITMGPLLLLWALPVVFALALVLGILRASGLLDRLTTAVHPLLKPFGLSGRDLVRIVAGFGCNVPAVISTRSCSNCTRDATIGAIAFGSACSYQFGATLAVLAAADKPNLVAPYLLLLVTGALIHARIVNRTPTQAIDLTMLTGRAFLQWPKPREIWREAQTTLTHVTFRALPIFFVLTLVASMLATYGAIERLATWLAPLLVVLRLPADTVIPIVAATLRKDGVLLMADPSVLAGLTDTQLLGALLFAGTILPCLVTVITIVRERTWRITLRLLGLQAGLAVVLAASVSWFGFGGWT